MSLTERDMRILLDLSECGELLTATIQEQYFSGDKSGRQTRRRLCELKKAGLIHSRLIIIGKQPKQSPSMSWALTKAGRKLVETQDDASMVS